jgi:hypothetical protein
MEGLSSPQMFSFLLFQIGSYITALRLWVNVNFLLNKEEVNRRVELRD